MTFKTSMQVNSCTQHFHQQSEHKGLSGGSQWQIILFMVVRTYPYEDQCTGVSHFILPLWHLDHRKLSWTGTAAQNLTHLRRTKQSSLTSTAEEYDTHIREEPDSDPFLFFGSVPPHEIRFSHIYLYTAVSTTQQLCFMVWGMSSLGCLSVWGCWAYIVCASSSCQLFSPSSTHWVLGCPAPLSHHIKSPASSHLSRTFW